MSFLDQFDELTSNNDHEKANELLFHWIENQRDELFTELRANRPVLEFWSRQPGNPDRPDQRGDGTAYLLTREAHVKKALNDFSMGPYALLGLFVLAEDDQAKHTDKRQKLGDALNVPDYPDKPGGNIPPVVGADILELIDGALNAAWAKHTHSFGTNDQVQLDYRAFAKDAALLFTGKYFGIPAEKIFPDSGGGLQQWSGQAYERFIWKIHARHFVANEPDPNNDALKPISAMAAELLPTAADTTVIGRMRQHIGTLGPETVVANIVGSIQGLVDNAMTGSSYAMAHLLSDPALLRQAQQQGTTGDLDGLKTMMQKAHQADTPSPFLPRRGRLADLPTDGPDGDQNLACAIGSAITEAVANGANGNSWDIRMGHGMHDCIGRYLGDEVMVRTLARALTLNEPKQMGDFEKQWGWIVKRLKIEGRMP